VTGSSTGTHTGRLLPYSQGDGASFVPGRPFAQGETVTVSALLRNERRQLQWQFRIAYVDLDARPPRTPARTHDARQAFRSRPDLRPPKVTVATPSHGYVFTAPYSAAGQAGPMIFDGGGRLVWFHPLPPGEIAGDFRVQRYRGHRVLTWWESTGAVGAHRVGDDVIANSSYREIARVGAGNGYRSELHEFLLTDRASALITAYQPIRCDLSRARGPADGAVWDTLLQEVDVATGLVRFEWHTLDHVALGDSFVHAGSATLAAPYDYAHLNSIDTGPGHSLLVSARNTWTVYELDRRTGRVRWRLGGKHSTLVLARGARPAWQHDARALAGGRVSLFDNGADPKVHPQSRALVFAVDPRRRKARLVQLLEHQRPLLSPTQGDVQALPGGGWFVGWGQDPYFSEFDRHGRVLFDARLPRQEECYRAFSFPWTGRPAEPPAVAVRRGYAYASWNGATEVARWQLLMGADPRALRAAGSAPRRGFETRLRVPRRARFVAVRALDRRGRTLRTSGVVSAS
jgi:hypothetical protein